MKVATIYMCSQDKGDKKCIQNFDGEMLLQLCYWKDIEGNGQITLR